MSKDFRRWKIDEAQLLPPSVQDYVPKDHLSRLIVSLVREELDLSAIRGSYSSGLGQPPFDPRMMTALLLHGYASGLYSSRRIARATVERADFMMIVAGDPPDFRTISEFRTQHRLSYNALTRQYRVSFGTLNQNFDTLDEALAVIGRVRYSPAVRFQEIEPENVYLAVLRLRLDTSQLPKPLQIDALGSSDWSLSSDWYRWTFKP